MGRLLTWHQIARMPKKTKVLDSLDPAVFDDLAKRLSLILGRNVSSTIIPKRNEWLVNYFNTTLNMTLHDLPVDTEEFYGWRCYEPMVSLHNFGVHPTGQGLGKKVFAELADTLRTAGFRSIVLHSQEEPMGFWCKMGFKSHKDGPRYMKLDL